MHNVGFVTFGGTGFMSKCGGHSYQCLKGIVDRGTFRFRSGRLLVG